MTIGQVKLDDYCCYPLLGIGVSLTRIGYGLSKIVDGALQGIRDLYENNQSSCAGKQILSGFKHFGIGIVESTMV